MFVKIKTFCIKVFLLTNQKKNVLISSQWEKHSNTNRSKTVVYKCKKKRRDERSKKEKH